jgi:hypothetical protein
VSVEEKLSTCGCCEGIEAATPAAVTNPPGQAQLVFKASMVDAIGRATALKGLTTRGDRDPSVAVMDAFAAALDVLTFYNERYANEGYLATATERRSVLELGRAIGYELAPGVAASTYLAFSCEETPGAPDAVTVKPGTKAQSIPAQDELPQVFETSIAIEARPLWNAMRPQLLARTQPASGDTSLYLEGLATNLRQGDAILFVHAGGAQTLPIDDGTSRWQLRRLLEVAPDNDARRTLIRWGGALNGNASPTSTVHALRTRAYLFGHNAPPSKSLAAFDKLYMHYAVSAESALKTVEGATLKAVSAPAGAPKESVSASISAAKILLPEDYFSGSTPFINLDMVYGQVVASQESDRRFAVLAAPSATSVFDITGVAEESVAEYTISGKTTRLTLDRDVPTAHNRRNTTVFCQSEALPIAETPLPDPMPRNAIVLDRDVPGLRKGQLVAFTGKPILAGAASEKPVSQVTSLQGVSMVNGHTGITLGTDLAWDFQRASVRINGNVAPATHGETRKEVLGSGDAAIALQTFVLKQTPLTYVRATNAAGAQSTLQVRVNELLWAEAPTHDTAQPGDQNYIVRLDDDGKARLTFGDGERGQRPPTGVENIEATYRVGIGQAGLVRANQISLLLTRPLGLRDVLNPTAPEGAEDPERLDDARENAPRKVLTLDRVVSLTDFENFARGFGGVAKARAVWLWDGEQRIVHITLAGPKAAAIAAGSDLGKALLEALDGARHPDIPVRLGPLDLRRFAMHARVKVAARYPNDKVLATLRQRVVDAFSFERMRFAEGVAASHVLALMQAVAGVAAVDLDALYFAVPNAMPTLATGLPALSADWSGSAVAPDQLLVIDPDGIQLSELAP